MAERKKSPQGGNGVLHPIPHGAATTSDTSGATAASCTSRIRNLGTGGQSRPTRGEGEASSQEPSDRGSSAMRDCGEPGSGTAGARLVIDVSASSDEEYDSDDERMMQALNESILSGKFQENVDDPGFDSDDDNVSLAKIAKFQSGRGGLHQSPSKSRAKKTASKQTPPTVNTGSSSLSPEDQIDPEKSLERVADTLAEKVKTSVSEIQDAVSELDGEVADAILRATENICIHAEDLRASHQLVLSRYLLGEASSVPTGPMTDMAAGLHVETQHIIDLAEGLPGEVPDGLIIELKTAASTIKRIGQKLLAKSNFGPGREPEEIRRLRLENESLQDTYAKQLKLYKTMMHHWHGIEVKLEAQVEKLQAESNEYCKELVSLRQAQSGQSGEPMSCTSADQDAKYSALLAEHQELQAQMAAVKSDNLRLEREIQAIKKELRRSGDKRSTRPSVSVQTDGKEHTDEEALDAFTASILRQMGTLIDAKLDARLPPVPSIRPPLKGDAPSNARVVKAPPSTTNTAQQRKCRDAAERVPIPEPAPPPKSATVENTPPISSAWSEVVKSGKRGKGKGKSSQAQAPAVQQQPKSSKSATTADNKPKKKPRLREPKTAAVVVGLDPQFGNACSELNKLLREAKSKIDVDELGLSGRLSTRTSRVTGKRILVVAADKEKGNAEAGEKADALASALLNALPPGMVSVTRPEKHIDVRLSGVDVTATASDISEAVAKAGECLPAHIKVGRITDNGSVVVRCPVLAAKKILAIGRTTIGWFVVRAALLSPRPLRCSRCLGANHGRGLCKSAEDRSSTCLRCGEIGHKSAVCTGETRCCLCAAAGRPASHRIGAKNCPEPKRVKEKPPDTKGAGESAMTVKERSPSPVIPNPTSSRVERAKTDRSLILRVPVNRSPGRKLPKRRK
ncbi:hypothetical protein ABMA28_005481 [Loxostege sticticalis]|uniref:CCHC-type domain-containing protein n=1 Tax=Loxostege sticticalis TaxID=481309 RepID=A0ABD0SQL8_LOXSC